MSSKKVYEIINSIVMSNDLLHSGQKLIEFADAVYEGKNRAAILNHFYGQLYMLAFCRVSHAPTNNGKKSNFLICEESHSVQMYLGLRIPPKTSPVKSINNIREFGKDILSNYTKPIGDCISESSIRDILKYLDDEYDFSKKVFPKRASYFVRINNSHKIHGSETFIAKSDDDIITHFFLYHMKEGDSANPETVFFHELGHAVHARRFDYFGKLPDNIIERLQGLGLPTFKDIDVLAQNELFADVIGIGLMCQSPFEKFDTRDEVDQDAKKEFKKFAKNILESL